MGNCFYIQIYRSGWYTYKGEPIKSRLVTVSSPYGDDETKDQTVNLEKVSTVKGFHPCSDEERTKGDHWRLRKIPQKSQGTDLDGYKVIRDGGGGRS